MYEYTPTPAGSGHFSPSWKFKSANNIQYSPLSNHLEVEPATIVCTVYVLPSPGLELAPAPWALDDTVIDCLSSNKSREFDQVWLFHHRGPAPLSKVRPQIYSLEEESWQISHVDIIQFPWCVSSFTDYTTRHILWLFFLSRNCLKIFKIRFEFVPYFFHKSIHRGPWFPQLKIFFLNSFRFR